MLPPKITAVQVITTRRPTYTVGKVEPEDFMPLDRKLVITLEGTHKPIEVDGADVPEFGDADELLAVAQQIVSDEYAEIRNREARIERLAEKIDVRAYPPADDFAQTFEIKGSAGGLVIQELIHRSTLPATIHERAAWFHNSKMRLLAARLMFERIEKLLKAIDPS